VLRRKEGAAHMLELTQDDEGTLSQLPDAEDALGVGVGFKPAPTIWSSLNLPPKDERWWSPKRLLGEVDDLVRRRTMTLTVENGVVRVVVFQGKSVIAWGVANPEEDFKPVGAGFKPAPTDLGALDDGYAPRLYALLKELHFRRLRLVTELPLYAPLIRHLRLPRIRRRFLPSVVSSEVLQLIPFSADEIDLTWQASPKEGGQDVFATAVPKRVVDEHVRVLKEAYLRPRATYSRAAALAFATGLSDAIVVHLIPSEAAVVLVREHVPRVVHKLNLPQGEDDARRHVEAIARAVEQVASYYRTLDIKDDPSSLPVVLTGQLAADAPVAAELRKVVQRQIWPFQPPLVYPGHFPPAEFAANIGLMLADRARSKLGGNLADHKGLSVNLLSQRHLPRPLPIRQTAVFVGLLLFGVAASSVKPQVDAAMLEAATLSSRVQSLEQQARQHRMTTARVNSLEEQTEATKQMVAALETRLTGLDTHIEDFLARMQAIVQDAPPEGVNVVSVTLQGNEFALAGTASSYEDVIKYTSNLRALGPRFFTHVRILRAEVGGSVEALAGAPQADGGGIVFQVRAGIPFSEEQEIAPESRPGRGRG
jgi:Tfp pilus assembly protein PilN